LSQHSVNSHKYCKAIVQKRAHSFYTALKWLPKEKRQALYALYAFARMADDVVDGHVQHMDLDTLRGQLERLYAAPLGEDSNDFMAALSWSIRKYGLPRNLFDDLLLGMESDLSKVHCHTFEETHTYCYQAASTVGLLCVEVFGYEDNNAKIYAHDLGIAMQLTNILRDLKEDYDNKRQYLPQEDFDAFGLTYEDLVLQRKPQEAERFMSFQSDRALTYYEHSARLFPMVTKNARYCPQALSYIYQEILKSIQQQPLKALRQKVRLSKSTKIKAVLRAVFNR